MERRDAIIELKELTIGYRSKGDRREVAQNINATLRSGELTAVLGANGVGKSTLIRTITKAQRALSGEVNLQGRALREYSAQELAQIISVVLTEKLELKNTTLFDLVSMGRAPYTGFWGALEKGDIDIVEESLEKVNISHLRDRMVDTLSDGERQKAMIAKALAQQTEMIILDEPTAFLDFPSKVETMHLLHRLAKQLGKTIMMSTHDLDLALQIADRVWIMDSGGVHVGVPEDLALDGTLSRFFQRKGVIFDMQQGLFRIDYQSNRKAQLIGEGDSYTMARKALMRCGVSVVESPAELVIKAFEGGFEVEFNGNRASAQTIEQMLELIL
ncbi:MAG: ABC transporter ATP-binding protein [Rikenellaceae bacterium]